jgi:hypothetical protein
MGFKSAAARPIQALRRGRLKKPPPFSFGRGWLAGGLGDERGVWADMHDKLPARPHGERQRATPTAHEPP